MNKRAASRIVRRVFILLALVGCLIQVSQDKAEALACNTDAAYACLRQGGKWSFGCCTCAPGSVVRACEVDFAHEYNVCTGECELVQ